MTFTPTIGSVLAIIVLLLGVLMALGVLPMTPMSVGGLLAALAISRLT